MIENLLTAGFTGVLAGATGVSLYAGRTRAELARARMAAECDCLTGLPNRAGLQRRYDADRQAGGWHTLALLDLDDFKYVNDTYGHEAGDRLLTQVARRLMQAFQGAGAVGRLGGDEFVILLPWNVRRSDGPGIETIPALVSTSTVTGEGIDVTASGSVGVALPTPDATWSTQLNQADIALYHAKAVPDGVVVFQEGMRLPQVNAGGRRDRHRRGFPA